MSTEENTAAAVSFADVPMTIGELRAEKSDDAKDISPRENLISVLRRIDRGEISLESLVVLFSWTDAQGLHTSYSVASQNRLVTVGLLADCLGAMTAR